MPYQATNAAFRKLERVMKRLSLTHEEHKIYERSLRHYLDNYNCLKSIQEESFQEGRDQERLNIARNLKQMGLSTEQIMKATALTADEIAKL